MAPTGKVTAKEIAKNAKKVSDNNKTLKKRAKLTVLTRGNNVYRTNLKKWPEQTDKQKGNVADAVLVVEDALGINMDEPGGSNVTGITV